MSANKIDAAGQGTGGSGEAGEAKPPSSISSPANKRICLIDLSGIARQMWHATEHEGASAMVGKTLQAVTGFAAGFDAVGICVDTPPYKRSEMSAEYKAHREKIPSVYFEQLRVIVHRLDRDGYHILGAKGYEADDVIAAACKWADDVNANGSGASVVVYSADKDLLQLVRVGVEVISSATGTVYADEAAVTAKLGVKPALVPDWLALVGDKSDGIPGIKGVGPKTASEWLNKHGGLEFVLQNVEQLEPARFREAVTAGKDVIAKSFLLAQLMDDAPINPEILMERKEVKREEPKEPELADEQPAPQIETTAMVPASNPVMQPVEYERALEPRDSGGAMKLAHYLFDSRMFGQFPTPEAVLAIILAGRAHGLGAFQALQGFHNIKGKPSASAQLIVGLVKRHPVCKYFQLIEASDKVATYETHRVGEPAATRMSYTIEQAKTAGLTGKDNWKNDAPSMLVARCGTRLARAVYPDIVSGLYSPDELEEAA